MLCSLNNNANHSKQQKKALQQNYTLTTGREGGFLFIYFFSQWWISPSNLNRYCCIFCSVFCYCTFFIYFCFSKFYIYIYIYIYIYGVVWLWHLLVICMYIGHHFIFLQPNSCDLLLIGRDSGLKLLCHSCCGFHYQQRVL